MKIAGIDPSMNSSGKVIMDLDDETFDIRDIQFYGYQPKLNAVLETEHVHIMCSGTDYDRMPMLVRQDRALAILDRDMEDVKYVSFEDYGIPQIKHFATGNGDANKIAMCEAMKAVYPQFYFPEFDQFPKQYESPHSDLCDAFWMCEILRNHIKHDILGPESLPDNVRALLCAPATKGSHDRRALVDYPVIIRKEWPVDLEKLAERKKPSRKK